MLDTDTCNLCVNYATFPDCQRISIKSIYAYMEIEIEVKILGQLD